MTFKRKLLLTLGLTAMLTNLSVLAQAYPSKPVRVIVPFAAGGPADNYARFISQRLQDAMGQPFIVDNRPGAGSVIGTDAVAKSAPDGYTLQLMRDFVGVAPINYSDLVLVANPALPANNLKELIARAKKMPGKINYASSGQGTPYHMAGELFKSMAGVYLVHIPYRGSSGARTDVIGGQVEVMFDAVTTMAEQVKAGKVKAIATTGKVRSAVLPDVPTMSEAGLPGYETTIWLGLMAPKGTPKAIVDKLNEAVSKIASQPDVKSLWLKQGAVSMVMTPEVFEKYTRDDITKWATVIKSANIKAD